MRLAGRLWALALMFFVGVAAALLVAVFPGGVDALPSLPTSTPWYAIMFGAMGVMQLCAALLLSLRKLQPGATWGSSAVGQALQGAAWAGLAGVGIAEKLEPSLPAWALASLPFILLVIGFRLEHKARARYLSH